VPQRVDSTLAKGLQILETLAASASSMGITELSASLGINKSSVHRLIKSLSATGYVTQDRDRSYRASFKLWKLGLSVMSHTNLAKVSARAMNALAKSTGESVHLAVLNGLQTLYIEKIDSAQPVRAYLPRGGEAPLHCVSTGKILLAFNYPSLRDAMIGRLTRYTPKTIAAMPALDAEMARVRASGIAVNNGEYRSDVVALAAAVRDPNDQVIAAVGISGPLSRMPRQRVKELTPLVIEAGEAISAELNEIVGYRRPAAGPVLAWQPKTRDAPRAGLKQ
jgi:DNA-binding IclR family transcriptional regulator